ncbi:alpha/beta fold hydrolase [Streptomyces alkaliphilus]|uniref:alpha/beta fold hydrolase n=1 Tax=Streptomyces alkaliphilus TaxID=1472722 RepID=UPI00117D455F|nr:alpha/beta fold hydrolase [Streptomyces alkaliphilus]MQS08649.1 alpha/beta fold hydrolase [Streptomyces alkaliphilus]
MDLPGVEDYARFLPPAWRERVSEPESATWKWRGHDVHVMRRREAEAPARVILVHGAGGHSAALWPIASLISPERAELAAVDMPLYGDTVSPDPSTVRYPAWVDLLCDFVAAEDDGRPLVLLGASIGGMLAHEVAARTDRVAEVIATCLLDPRDIRARSVMTRFGPLGILGGSLSRLLPAGLARRRIPMSRVAALSKMSRDPELSGMCARDPRGGGVEVPLGFLASYMTYRHIPPERMRTPLTLAHPARDAWTPMGISTRWLHRIAAPVELVPLRECGHFPVEEPGLTDLIHTVEKVIARSAKL